jgi:protein-S-isoprenylcysteine O-methyltransferase Ste14
MQMFAGIIVSICWIIFCIYWFINSSKQKQTEEKPKLNILFSYRIFWTLAFALLLGPTHMSFDFNVLPNFLILNIFADLIAIAGLLICIAARMTLSDNWSMGLDFKKNHKLITTGPYQYMRHPIYTGFLMMFIGTALVIEKIGGIMGIILLLIGTVIRIRNEEILMIENFPQEYPQYKKKIKALIPFIF